MEYDPMKADLLVICPACDWHGRLELTEDAEVFGPEYEVERRTCVCPKCGAEVSPA